MLPARSIVPACLRVTVAALLLVITARAVLFSTYRVSGMSMLEALQHGDRILVGQHRWLYQPLGNGDTIVLAVDGEILVKRIVASPGQSIAMAEGTLMRNGSRLQEHIPAHLNRKDSFPPYELAWNEYFVLGDNRRVSIDSRDFGPVTPQQVMGRVLLRIGRDGLGTVSGVEE